MKLIENINEIIWSFKQLFIIRWEWRKWVQSLLDETFDEKETSKNSRTTLMKSSFHICKYLLANKIYISYLKVQAFWWYISKHYPKRFKINF